MEMQPTTDRMIQEYVPGKQVTLAHLIANLVKICSRNWACRIQSRRLAF